MSIDPNLPLASCCCGQVAFSVSGRPILHAACYCTSCRTAGQAFAQMPGATPVVADDGGTDLVLYRKDRVTLVRGADRLSEHRLTPGSPTRRMLASCCNTPVVMDFTKGHWLSVYRGRLAADVPPLDMRVMTADRPAGVTLPDDVPSYPAHSGKFMWRLVTAWAAMGFRRPKVI